MKAVKEEKMDKYQLEAYRDQLSSLFGELNIELAEIEKAKAIYFDEKKTLDPTATDISIKRKWQASDKGLREIVLKRYIIATKELLSSLRNRLYNFL